MNKNSNTYIIIYATVMVVVVALVLAFASLSLQGRQRANAENEMKGALLSSIGVNIVPEKGVNQTQFINDQYDKHIKRGFAVTADGNVVEQANAFDILKDLKGEYEKPASERELPIFESVDEQGVVKYIIPVRGSGLWGPIWGYVALEKDWNTISGAVFDHQGETPGLGAEIATPFFEDQFKGKQLYDGSRLVGISVVKGTSGNNPHAVDAISGGTITSRGVQTMLKNSIEGYDAFIQKQSVASSAREQVDNEVNAEGHE